MPLSDYLRLLRPGGTFVMVGAPEVDAMPELHPFFFILSKSSDRHTASCNLGASILTP
jgi:D-arabinose 1-dehydrogenase-like Zn-dependent alcohol dehydrogenase